MNPDKIARQFNAFHKLKTREHAPGVYKALQAQINYFVKTGNVDGLPLAPVADQLKSIYIDAGPLWAQQSYLNVMRDVIPKKENGPVISLKLAVPIGYNESFINAMLQFYKTDFLNTASDITETTKDFIRRSISDGLSRGEDLDYIINGIKKSGFTEQRAALIARTEVMKASNYGEQLGTDKTGVATKKEWIAVRDKRTRRDHNTTDGQIVADGAPFDVGLENWKMLRPGADITVNGLKVPAKEKCNCRCTIGRHVIRDKTGAAVHVAPVPPAPVHIPAAVHVTPSAIAARGAFRPAANMTEIENRIKAFGVKHVDLSGFDLRQSNAVLNAFENEQNFSPLHVERLITVNNPDANYNAQYHYGPRQISLNIAKIGKSAFTQPVTYAEKIAVYKESITQYESLRGAAGYNQRSLTSAIRAAKKSIAIMEERITAGNDALYWSMSSSYRDELDKIFTTVTHEIGHNRQHRQTGLFTPYKFSKVNPVTEYSLKNREEYFTEWYTFYRLKGAAGVPDDLLELFKKL